MHLPALWEILFKSLMQLCRTLNFLIYLLRALKKKRAGDLGTETSTSMSEILALAVEALVLLRHKAVNGCLVEFPGLRCEPVKRILLEVVVRGESFAPQSLF